MPNLFPLDEDTSTETAETASKVSFGKSWRFDFENGEFVLTPAGKVTETSDVEAWLEWCKKALITARYRYLVYSRNYGQEFDDLISRHLSRSANESEIKRIATEALMVDPRTASVNNFKFTWEGDTVYFTCDATNTRSETGTINGQVVIS
jgi:hypothetical protein